jgi:hypothetical protein
MLTRLRDYYSKQNARPESIVPAPSEQFEDDSEDSNKLRLRDGFLLPQEADEGHVDTLLDEYSENRYRISNMCRPILVIQVS